MTVEQYERLQVELSLLESMYPEQMRWDSKARQVNYSAEGAGFQLRVPDDYLGDGLPYVVSASAGRQDLSEQLRRVVKECPLGEEILDSIILSFNDLAEDAVAAEQSQHQPQQEDKSLCEFKSKATMIVWLHHLLNTNKRKQALSPSFPGVSGVTKPGYPGVLIYSGPALGVREHVNELKQLNWAAFQVRLEAEEEWLFAHGAGVKEVEAMKDVVVEVGEQKKAEFLEAMKMK